jgi:mono/diheme cytochrome c family protein
MKHFLLGVVTTLAVLVGGTLLYLRLGLAEVRADIPPSQWETSLLSTAVHASVRREALEVANPVDPTDENLIDGGRMYLNECAGCHGAAGKKDYGDVLYPPIPQFSKVGTEYSEAQVFWVAKHGIRRAGMFANGKWESDQKLWTIAAYIKRMQTLPPAVQEALAPKKEGGSAGK